MNINQALKWGFENLKKSKILTPILDSEVLLAFVLKKPKEFLYTYPEKKLTSRQARRLRILINKRAKFEPVAYLINNKEFYGFNFYVDKNVLIPRPESELLIDEVLEVLIFRQARNDKIKKKEITIADIGTGSGCLIIALAKILNTISHAISYIATDISKSALKVAKLNTKRHQVKIRFLKGDLLKPLTNKKTSPEFYQRIDIIIANLPYLDNKYLKNKGSKYEPKVALDGGKDGTDLYKKLFIQLKEYKTKPKIIILEINPKQLSKIKKMIKFYLPKAEIKIKKDLAGLNRMVIIKFNHHFLTKSYNN